jgi:hypothetical protein
MYDSNYMKCPGQVNLQRQDLKRGKWGMTRLSFGDKENFLK